jgi:hypothetical protein
MNLAAYLENEKTPFRLISGVSVLILAEVIWFISSIWGIQRSIDWWGDIGSLIGGMSAPLVGLLSAILLYLTFQQQKNALADEAARNRVIRDIERIREQFESTMEYLPRITNTNHQGLQAIHSNYSLDEHVWTTQEFFFVIEMLTAAKKQLDNLSSRPQDNDTNKSLLKEEKDILSGMMNKYARKIILPCLNSIITKNEQGISNDQNRAIKLQEVKNIRDDFKKQFGIA